MKFCNFKAFLLSTSIFVHQKRLGVYWGISIPYANNRSPMIAILLILLVSRTSVLLISQIYNFQPELKHNKEQMLRQYSLSPNNAKPNVDGSNCKKLLFFDNFYYSKISTSFYNFFFMFKNFKKIFFCIT